MAITNHDRISKAMDLLKVGIAPYVEREMTSIYAEQALMQARTYLGEDRLLVDKPFTEWDVAALLKLMWESWNSVFKQTLGFAERSLVSELRDVRNKWAHQQAFTSDDADRALDSAARLLTAISAAQADEVNKMKMELRRVIFDEQARSEKRRAVQTTIESSSDPTLKPWREVVTPHQDVASGRYQQAEFAADLWQVYLGEGVDEYRDPVEFFRRTYLTDSLKGLLTGALQRLSGKGADPVVQLQTNFGGGKTHSMLALYHLFSGVKETQLTGVEEVVTRAGVESIPKANRVVLVGNKISPGNPSVKADGTVVRTLWGEFAWQLGGKKAFQKIQADDEKATSPGDALRELMVEYGPCLILIDEWVAYARQLHDKDDLPAGTFETHFTFAQTLTESAKDAKNCLLVISLPASDTTGSPHAVADDIEVGGERGRAALQRLRNAVGRVEASWRPATAEEGFEIVRRRLFEPLISKEQFVARDTVAQSFFDMYRSQQQEFPSECHEADYEKRIKAAYPIHPEVFDRLYNDWSTLVKFQRTRGVLRLMAAVIHSLWEKGDKNPLILPAHVGIDDPRIQSELTRYLSDNWMPIIEKDVDGPNSLPVQIDAQFSNLGKYSASRRVARTIYLGSAPSAGDSHRGIEDRRVRLGCVMPGESPAVFGDALRRLSSRATYLYQDGTRYWYDTKPTVTKLAGDRSEQFRRDIDAVVTEIDKRLRINLRTTGDFGRVHPVPQSSADVPDEMDTRLVVLGVGQPYSKEAKSKAIVAAQEILENRGTAPRLYRNSLIFLAVDQTRLQELDESVRHYLAWESILTDKESLDLTAHQIKQAETQKSAANSAIDAKLPEAYQWLLVPTQSKPQAKIEWQAIRLSGLDSLATRASKRLRNDELMITALAGTRLKMELDRIPLWRGDHVSMVQLSDDFSRYLYLPRLSSPAVLTEAVRDGVSLMTWQQETFGYADSYDETSERYRGIRCGENISLFSPNSGLVVRSEKAQAQRTADQQQAALESTDSQPIPMTSTDAVTSNQPVVPVQTKPKRFHGSVNLDPSRVGRDAGRIAEEVLSHLVALDGATVKVTMEIEAVIPEGASDQVVRTVTENGRTLKFTSQGFEKE